MAVADVNLCNNIVNRINEGFEQDRIDQAAKIENICWDNYYDCNMDYNCDCPFVQRLLY
jgi:hypothetical protein